MKIIEIETEDGVATLPLEIVINNRNDYYADKDGDEFDEVVETSLLEEDDYEAIDWLENSMNVEDIHPHINEKISLDELEGAVMNCDNKIVKEID